MNIILLYCSGAQHPKLHDFKRPIGCGASSFPQHSPSQSFLETAAETAGELQAATTSAGRGNVELQSLVLTAERSSVRTRKLPKTKLHRPKSGIQGERCFKVLPATLPGRDLHSRVVHFRGRTTTRHSGNSDMSSNVWMKRLGTTKLSK